MINAAVFTSNETIVSHALCSEPVLERTGAAALACRLVIPSASGMDIETENRRSADARNRAGAIRKGCGSLAVSAQLKGGGGQCPFTTSTFTTIQAPRQ